LHDFFFEECRIEPGRDFQGARITWTTEVLDDINQERLGHRFLPKENLIVHVIKKLLESVVAEQPGTHQGAIDDVKGILEEEGLIVHYADERHVVTRRIETLGTSDLIGLSQIESCLDSFAAHIESVQRMRFWRGQRWRPSPEIYAQELLYTFVCAWFHDNDFAFRDVVAGAGKVDMLIITPLGLKCIIELKMCGKPYSLDWAGGGADQLYHYMQNRPSRVGYLLVFDGRTRDFGQGFEDSSVRDNMRIISKVVDVRRSIKPTQP